MYQLPLSLQTAAPALLSVRLSDFVGAPLRLNPPLALVTPMPLMVPPPQSIIPLTVTALEPPSVALFAIIRDGKVRVCSVLLKLAVPFWLIAKAPVLVTLPLKLAVPPLIRVFPVTA